ncbi:hypothetical protein SDC9_164750 [bioreactor metagenome]|uniref:Uncharacterized protein n=1 Tax=bioreactor metagenome TaxID=1076179 RepID=A0A645FSI0_9ZZZZ|nr:hypothetical protein [Oscillospiraceae bacterium]
MAKIIIRCCCCEESPDKTSIALCKKFLGKNTKRFYCISCLAIYLDTSIDELLVKAQEFKEEGCTLFM